MQHRLIRALHDRVSPKRVVLVTGAWQDEDSALRAGIAEALADRREPIDLDLVPLALAHVTDRSQIEALHQACIQPARAAGVTALCLAGISFGGLVAIEYVARHPGAVDMLGLLSPYLGTRIILREIADYASLSAWAGDSATDRADSLTEERAIWRYVARHAAHDRWFLGFGTGDRFADAHRMLASAMREEQVVALAGGHDWTAWRPLWDQLLDRFCS